MSDFRDKGDTFRFRPGEDKPQINRSENDEYSSARRSKAYEEEEKSSNILPYVAIILAILLIIAIVAGIFILKQEKEPENNIPENDTVTVIDEDENEEEEEINITLVCSMVFDSSRVYKTDDGYAVLADLYDKDFYSFDSRKLIINEETDIRESGKRISKDALIYLIRDTAGDAIIFDGEIRESDNTLLSISFDSSVLENPEEDLPEEETNPPSEGEVSEGEENKGETLPEEENKSE